MVDGIASGSIGCGEGQAGALGLIGLPADVGLVAI